MKTLVTVYQKELKRMIFNSSAMAKLNAVSEVEWIEEGRTLSSDELKKIIAPYDVCLTGWGSPKLTADVLENAQNLKFIGHTAGTVIPIADEGVFERGITIVNANSALARSTAEGTIALMMAGAWNIHAYNMNMRKGIWSNSKKENVMGLYGQVIGIIGYGDISKEVIRLLKPYDPQILLYSSHYSPEEARKLGIKLCSLEELMRESRIISLHNTLTPTTRGMIGKKELDLIGDGALLVNTARAPIIDEQALMECLKSGRINAALDVYEKEPLAADHILLNLPNVICTPHIAGFSSYWKSRLGESVIDDLCRWVKGEPLHGRITHDKFLQMTPR